MPKIEPIRAARPLNLVAVRTVTGATTFLVTRHPNEQLAHLGTVLEVDEKLVVETPYADEIMQRLRCDLDRQRLDTQEGSFFAVDWETVERLVADFDPATGHRIRLGDLSVGDTVWAKVADADGPITLSRCNLIGIAGRLYLLELLNPIGGVRRLALPRHLLKPHLRHQALAEAA